METITTDTDHITGTLDPADADGRYTLPCTPAASPPTKRTAS